MPVKVVNTGTDILNGEIDKTDLEKMKTSFDTEVTLTRTGTSTILHKKIAFFFTKEQFQSLFDSAGTASLVRVNIAIQLNQLNGDDIRDLCENSISNSMAAVIEMVNTNPVTKEKATLNEVENFVLINGFQNNQITPLASDGACCPSTSP